MNIITIILTMVITIFIMCIKHIKIFDIILFMLVLLFMGLNYNNPDSNVYENIYAEHFWTKDVLYGVFCYFGNLLNMTYAQFRFCLYDISLLLILIAIYKLNIRFSCFVILYLLSNLFWDIVQLRNFIGVSFVFYGIVSYITSNKKCILFLFTIIGALIQKTHLIWFYFFVIVIILRKYNSLTKCYILFSVLLGILVLSPSALNFLISILDKIELAGLDIYLERTNRFGFLKVWVQNLFQLVSIWYINNRLKNTSGIFRKYTNYIYLINVASLIFLPFFVLNINFGRIIRNIFLINIPIYIYYLFITYKKHRINTEITMSNLILFGFLILNFYINFVYDEANYLDTIIINSFTHNYFFDILNFIK